MADEKDGAELKTCPMCDGKAYANTVNRDRWQGRSGVYVACQRMSCGVHGRVYATRAKAIAAWNTRASDAQLTERDAEGKRIHAEDQRQIDKHMDHIADIAMKLHTPVGMNSAQYAEVVTSLLATQTAMVETLAEALKWFASSRNSFIGACTSHDFKAFCSCGGCNLYRAFDRSDAALVAAGKGAEV